MTEWIIGEKLHSDSHHTPAITLLPCHCVSACLISVGDSDTAARMAQESGWMGRQFRFHFPETAKHSS